MLIGLTGATGFLGRHVIRQAEADGHGIVAFSRNRSAVVPGAREVRAWGLDIPPNVDGCDAVIHLAGESIMGVWTPAKRHTIRESRVLGTRSLVAAFAASATPPRSLICASAIGYYGHRGDDPLDESAAAGDGFLAEVTSAWETEALRAQPGGTRVVRGRIGIVLGPDGGAWPLLRRVFRFGLGGRLGSGHQWMSWVHVADVAALLVTAAADDRYEGPVNLVSPQPVTNVEFTQEIARAVHRPAVLPVPAIVLRTALRDQAALLLDSQRVVPHAAQALGYKFRFSSLAAALDNLVREPC